MSELKTKKLLVKQEKQLNDWLCSSDQALGTLNLMELKGFLFGICATPTMLPPSFWLPLVFGGELPEFDEVGIDNLPLLMQLYNYINQQVVDGKAKLPFKPILDVDNLSNNFQRGNPLQEWSFGFDLALQVTMDCWGEQELDSDEDDFANMCWLFLTFFADEQRTRDEYKKESKTKKKFTEFAQLFVDEMSDVMRAYASFSRDIYVENLNAMSADGGLVKRQDDLFDADDGGLSLADELIERARSVLTRHESIHLAKEALKLDPNNLNAHMHMALNCAANLKERIGWLEQAVACEASNLGEKFIAENTGHFWLIHETRPYMDALHELADAYCEAGRLGDAVRCYEQCLTLNPNDNQGVRHILMGVYIQLHKLDKASQLLKAYEDDRSAFMCFSGVLIGYISNGDCAKSRALKAEAKNYNKYVPQYLSSKQKMPKTLPEYYGIGDKNEAIIYTHFHLEAWRKTMGAIGWLMK